MRIAVAAHAGTRVGGVEVYLASAIPALVAAGHTVACWFEETGPGREPILGPDRQTPIWTASAPAGGSRVEELRSWRPDVVVHTHGLRDVEHERALLGVAPSVFFAHSHVGTCISGTRTHAAAFGARVHACVRPRVLAAVLPAALRWLEPDDDGASVTSCNGHALACWATTRASWWPASTWPTNTHVTGARRASGALSNRIAAAGCGCSPAVHVVASALSRTARGVEGGTRRPRKRGPRLGDRPAPRGTPDVWRGFRARGARSAGRRAHAPVQQPSRDLHRLARRASGGPGTRPFGSAARAQLLAGTLRHRGRGGGAAGGAGSGVCPRRHSRSGSRMV